MKDSKYRAKRTSSKDGIEHPSKKEARRWDQLCLLERAGEVKNLRRQVVIKLEGRDGPVKSESGRQMRLTVDFAYQDKRLGWAEVLEECKGVKTRDYLVRKAVAQAMGVEITET